MERLHDNSKREGIAFDVRRNVARCGQFGTAPKHNLQPIKTKKGTSLSGGQTATTRSWSSGWVCGLGLHKWTHGCRSHFETEKSGYRESHQSLGEGETGSSRAKAASASQDSGSSGTSQEAWRAGPGRAGAGAERAGAAAKPCREAAAGVLGAGKRHRRTSGLPRPRQWTRPGGAGPARLGPYHVLGGGGGDSPRSWRTGRGRQWQSPGRWTRPAPSPAPGRSCRAGGRGRSSAASPWPRLGPRSLGLRSPPAPPSASQALRA